MTRLDEIIANAIAGIPETDVSILAREVVRLREARAVAVPELTDEDLNCYSMDCDERDAVEFGYNLAASRTIPAGRVAIPPLTGGEIEARLLRLFPDISEDDPLRESCFKDSRWAYNLAVSRARAIPADRVLGDENQFGVGFVEACGILAAKPFDRPTLAAGLIREGGMIAALAETPSDGPGISILREEMRADLDALRANQGGAAT